MMTFLRLKTERTNLLVSLTLAGLLILMPDTEALGGKGGGGSYTVQVASYKNIDGAAALIGLLKAQGHAPFCRTVEIPGKGEWRRVCVGRYTSREEALRAGENLRKRGIIKRFVTVKTDPQEKVAVLGRKTAKERGAPAPPLLLKKKISPAPVLTQGTTAPHDTKDAVSPKKDITATKTGLYENALSDFSSERYGDALQKFEKILGVDKDETVRRRIADCHYFLGKTGDKGHLSKAVDYYRSVIRNYPGLNSENITSTYRLADSYRRLNLHCEALVEFKKVYANYPESGYTSEALYVMGTISYERKRFAEAIEIFKEYIQRFPDGSHIRDAYFGVGDCYSRMRQFNDANVWYDNALKKWPTLEDIPKDALRRLGIHRFQTGRYNDALGLFFAYLNLFPDGEASRDTLYAIARCFEKAGQLSSALTTLCLVIERYPESREAKESALIMANIGVDNPGIPVPGYIFAGMNGYRDPIEVYRAMEGNLSDPGMREEVLFRKGVALIKKKRYREACEAGRSLLAAFPGGRYREAGEKNLMVAAGHLIDDYYAKEDYISVVDLYFDLDRDGLFRSGDFGMLSQIGKSLTEMSLLDHAAGFFEEMIRVFGNEEHARGLLLDMAKIDYGRGRYADAKKRLQPLIEACSGIDHEAEAAARSLMGNILYEEGAYRDAAGCYAALLEPRTDPGTDAAIRKRYADTLREMGMYASALVHYTRSLKECGGAGRQYCGPLDLQCYEEMGDCLYRTGRYEQAIRMYQRSLDSTPEGTCSRWARVNIGRGYAKLGGDLVPAEWPVMPQGEGNDEFWSRVVDYYRADQKWTEQYGPYIKDS